METMTPGIVRFDSETWKDKEWAIAAEKQIVGMVMDWARIEPPPVDITLSTDWGFRCFVYPKPGSTEEELHRLLAWFVRRSGKKFVRHFREESGKVGWWNISNDKFLNGELQALFLIENFPTGNCKIVEVEETKKVKKLFCEEASA